ncbi:MAG: energy-coupling factor ABC transporter substrate-binding protein [Clostridia bacterium]
MKLWIRNLILLAMVVVFAIIPLIMIDDSEFGGADGQAEELIMEIDPSYEPWFEPIIELPGGETESLLFCVQAAIGGIIIGFGMGRISANYKEKVK